MKPRRSDWRAWVEKAKHDQLCIANNLAAAQTPWDTVCFHAQQQAEKMLKAFLAFKGSEPRKIHDLITLLGECVNCDASLSTLEEDCRRLNAYAAEVRYPEELAEPGPDEGRDAVAATERICSAIAALLPNCG